MGHEKFATKGDWLEANKHFIIAEYTGVHGKRRTARSLAVELDVPLRTLERHISAWREDGLIEYACIHRIDRDRAMVEELHRNGLYPHEIGEKLGYSRNTVDSALERWGHKPVADRQTAEQMPKISLNDLKLQWSVITEETIVTVGRIPRFRLIPIGRDDENYEK